MPGPGKSVTAKFPVGAKSTEATVTVSGDAASDTGVAVNEKAQRLKKLRGIQRRLEAKCHTAIAAAGFFDAGAGEDLLDDLRVLSPRARSLALACRALLDKIQERIDELRSSRRTQAAAGQDASCLLVQARLRLVKRVGKPAVVTVVKKGLRPRLNVSCEATEEGLELVIRRRGKGTLRQALGKSLVLTIRRSSQAPPADPGATLSVGYSQG